MEDALCAESNKKNQYSDFLTLLWLHPCADEMAKWVTGQIAQGQFAHRQFTQKNEKIKLKIPNLTIVT